MLHHRSILLIDSNHLRRTDITHLLETTLTYFWVDEATGMEAALRHMDVQFYDFVLANVADVSEEMQEILHHETITMIGSKVPMLLYECNAEQPLFSFYAEKTILPPISSAHIEPYLSEIVYWCDVVKHLRHLNESTSGLSGTSYVGSIEINQDWNITNVSVQPSSDFEPWTSFIGQPAEILLGGDVSLPIQELQKNPPYSRYIVNPTHLFRKAFLSLTLFPSENDITIHLSEWIFRPMSPTKRRQKTKLNRETISTMYLTALLEELEFPVETLKTDVETLEQLIEPSHSEFQFIDSIKQHCSVIQQLVDRIHEYLLPDFDKPEVSTVDLKEVLLELYDVFEYQNEAKITWEIKGLPEDPFFVEMDEFKFKQILIHLLTNAFDHTTKGNIQLAISLDSAADAEFVDVSLSVSDTGTGINEEDMPHLFTPGWSTSKEESLGVGLSVTKELVEQLQGHIRVSSTFGVGSSFTVTLPLRKVAFDFFSEPPKPEKKEPEHALQLILLSHSTPVIELFETMFNPKDFKFIANPDVRLIRSAIQSSEVSLILLEASHLKDKNLMGELDECFTSLNQQLPRIVVLANSSEIDTLRYHPMVDEVFPIPINIKHLNVIKRLVETPRNDREKRVATYSRKKWVSGLIQELEKNGHKYKEGIIQGLVENDLTAIIRVLNRLPEHLISLSTLYRYAISSNYEEIMNLKSDLVSIGYIREPLVDATETNPLTQK